jgi:hypothetical protein
MTSQTRLPRYSITGLMLFTLGIAGGLTAALAVKQADMSLFGVVDTTSAFQINRVVAGLSCALLIWIAVGLLYQAWDIGRFLRANPIQSAGQRAALQFDVLWRTSIAFLLPFSYLLQHIGRSWKTFDEELSALGTFFSTTHWNDVRWLLMLVAIGGSRGFRVRKASTGIVSKMSNCAGYLACFILAMIVIVDAGLLPTLVRIAINGVEGAEPLVWKRSPVGMELVAAEQKFLFVSIFESVCALVGFGAAAWWASSGDRREIRKRRIVGNVAVLAASASIGAEGWIRFVGWPAISPSMAEVLLYVPRLTALLITAIAVCYLAARMSCNSNESRPVLWRVHPRAYLHERRLVLVVAFVVAAVRIAGGIIEGFDYQGFLSALTTTANHLEFFFGFLVAAENYWPLAIAVVSVQQFRIAGGAITSDAVTFDFSWRRFVRNAAMFGLVMTSLALAARTWSVAAWLPFG